MAHPSLMLLEPAHLATLCHELRQPLHAYRMFSDQLTPLLTDHPLALATQMDAAISDLTEMSQTLNEMAHALDANTHPQLRTVQLRPLLAELQNSFANPRLKIRQSKLLSETDSTRLATILKHLVRNALQHGSGRCLVGCRKRAGEIRLDVIDQGPGLPETSPNPGPRHRKTGAVSPRHGLGLGLHIVRQLAARLELRLEIVSRPGHGTRVSLFLPDTSVTSNLITQHHSRQQWLSGKTIHLAGMGLKARNELETLLATWGAKITSDASQASAQNPDLIITDNLPAHANGKHCTTLILATPPAVSPAPGMRYLPPPTTPPRLRMVIANILGKHI